MKTKEATGQHLLFGEEAPASAAVAGAARDLSKVIVVVPGRRAGRRLLELLAFDARDRQLHFSPPTIATEGKLPELLYHPKRPFADPLTQDLAWSRAIRELTESQRNAIVPHPPAANDEAAWLQLGRLLRVRHTELAADALTFNDGVRSGETLPKFPDARRWQAMQVAQDAYLRMLDELLLWDIQTARLKAIEFKEIATDFDIVLLGTVDLNRTMRKFLDEVSNRVTALVAAPESLADRFDSYGCVIPSAWQEVEIPLDDNDVLRVDGAADQADAVAKILAGYEGKYRGDQITVGMPDENLVAHVQRQLEQCQVPVRWVQGKLLPATAPYRLLEAIAALLREASTDAFAALLRHPDVFIRLTATSGDQRVDFRVLEELDRLQADYLVSRLNPKAWPHEVRHRLEEKRDFTNVVQSLEHVNALIAPLKAKPQRLSAWSQPLLAVLQTVYAARCDDLHTLAALAKIRDCLQLHAVLPERLDPKLPAEEAIAWTLEQLQSEAVPPPANEEAVELLGWLELPLDDAPALIVTTFNEGFTPEASTDTFLPNSLRKALGLIDNDRRYAPDAYAVSSLLASRESVHWITARRDAEENPLVPSRLLFATESQRVVTRARRFFQALQDVPPRVPLVGAGLSSIEKSRLYVPRPPDEIELSDRLRVTQFKDYLACPYRFYLRHVLRVEAAQSRCEEMPANAYGNLMHKVLERFGASPENRDSAKQDDIFDFLVETLQQCVGMRYGDRDRLAAVEIQVEQMRARLKKFSQWQAGHRSEGWRITYSETTEDASAPEETAETKLPPRERDAELMVDDRPFFLRGRIDRIDEHEDGGRFRIFDYKTGDRCDTPEQAHRHRKTDWVDLQLPLYRHLAQAWAFEGEMELGYIVIPKSLNNIGALLADWRDDALATADETMRSVVRKIRAHTFWPPNAPPDYADDFTALCQDRRLGGRLFEQELP